MRPAGALPARGLCLLGLWVGLFLGLSDPAQAAEAEGVLRLDQAQFAAEGGVPGAVALPDSWRQRGLPAKGEARYLLRFTLQQPPGLPWAARFDRVAISRVVWLNGVVIESRAVAPEVWRNQRPMPALMQLPPHLLRGGDNLLELQLAYGGAGGLSAVELGPQRLLQPVHERGWVWAIGLPQTLNLATAGLALFMILIWFQRRAEIAIGSFGLIWLLSSLRNVAYYLEGAWAYGDFASWFYSDVHAWGASLLGVLAMNLAGVRWRWYGRALLALALLWPVLAALALWLGEPLRLRQWGYPVLAVLCLPALWLLLRAALQAPGRRRFGLFAGVLLAIGAALHDLMFLGGQVSVMSRLWQPVVVPLVMAGFAWALVRRMVNALAQVERANVDLERAVAERTAQLAAANAAKTRFLAAASHDLRQPLHAISVLVALMSRRIRGGLLLQVNERLGKSVAGMQTLLNGLLDMSRLEMGRDAPRHEALSVDALLQRLLHDFAPIAAERGLQLRLRRHARGRGAWVRSDEVMLGRVLANLLSNALRYTERGTVLLAVRPRRDEVWIEVWDTGIGIAVPQQARIFEEFVQLDEARHVSQAGVGLGLSIVRRTVELLGVALELRSKPGRGSRFRLRLPRVPGLMAQPLSAVSSPPAAPRGLFVLVVDDDEAVRFAMKALLSDLGCRVEVARGGNDALQLLDRHLRQPDALIVDYRLPGETGFEVLARLREHLGSTVPAALITGEHQLDVLRAHAAEDMVVMSKPLALQQLADWLAGVAARLPPGRGSLERQGSELSAARTPPIGTSPSPAAE